MSSACILARLQSLPGPQRPENQIVGRLAVDQALLAFLGVVIGGLITTGTTWLTNWQAANRERDQWERQHKAEEEARQRQQQAEEQVRLRATLQEIYDKALYYSPPQAVTTIVGVSERAKWWNLLALNYYYDKGSNEYRQLRYDIDHDCLLAADIVNAAAQDPRLQIDYKPKAN